MGNYKDLENEFIERSIALIEQYNGILSQFKFEEQYNYTLSINCLLGLIVLPKEKIITYIPNTRLTKKFREKLGLNTSEIYHEIKTLKDLISKLRHSVAHFDMKVISHDDNFLINEIVFMDGGREIMNIKANELLPFLKYYSNLLLQNLNKYRQDNSP